MASDNISIQDLTVGVSGTGMDQYIETLRGSFYDDTIKILDDFYGILSVIKSGWAGKSYDAFENDFKRRLDEVKHGLAAENNDLFLKLGDIKRAYYAVDNTLYDEE